eukprot:3307202-Prymnesium_polylepis.1
MQPLDCGTDCALALQTDPAGHQPDTGSRLAQSRPELPTEWAKAAPPPPFRLWIRMLVRLPAAPHLPPRTCFRAHPARPSSGAAPCGLSHLPGASPLRWWIPGFAHRAGRGASCWGSVRRKGRSNPGDLGPFSECHTLAQL